MHPGMMHWWRARNQRVWGAECGAAFAGTGHEFWAHRETRWAAPPGDVGSGAFGVRRPLRYLAYKLDLSEQQVAELACILGDLKTERAQSEVDGRRTLAAFAEAFGKDSFDAARAGEGAALRVRSAERLRDAIVGALGRIHALLDPEQRGRFAYLIRTGAITL